MSKTINVLNELLVDLFNDILTIEQRALSEGEFKDLSITEIHTIEAIGMYEARSMSEVAKDLEITVGTLTTAINNLVKKGYVERERLEGDRRVVLIRLTKRGKLAYRIHDKFHKDMIRETIQDLSEQEEEVLIHSLEKLNRFFKSKYNLTSKEG
ncbi:MarR family transcriptional regulator [Clostridium swellfunianum]|uniref:MarR family winged helix-turn-helix transcriptional regulator n=1 Tax=Clostridium swellfunianum TaxID=1367462 RepID=UPI00202F6547|nr:MarR family transcriptional regulator [Clostridium swellfunianum]MCM0650316.1 MarR family transcriptional regulator [Clostridium swellfunianum]